MQTSERPLTRLEVDVDRWTLIALGVSTLLLLLNWLLGLLKFLGHDSLLTTLLSYFDSNPELTFNAWFSAILLLAGAVGATAARLDSEDHRRGFTALAWLLVYLSLDEATALHERIGPLIREDLFSYEWFVWLVETFGVRLAEWLLVGSALAVVVGALFIPFLVKLPSGVRSGFLIGGAIFVFSAIFTDLLGGFFHQSFGPSAGSDLASSLEEFGEMIGAIIVGRTCFLVASLGADRVEVRQILRPSSLQTNSEMTP